MRTVLSDYVTRDGGLIRICRLDHQKASTAFLKAVKDGVNRGYRDFEIEVVSKSAAFPNALVPIAGIIERFRNEGCSFELSVCPKTIEQTLFFSPKEYEDGNPYVMNKVWEFSSSSQIAKLVNAFIGDLRKTAVFKKGVLDSIEWSINEVMDNVLQHAEVDTGYVMGQLHSTSSVVAFTVYDFGQGMLNSFRYSDHHPRKAIDAITLAIQESITRDRSIGQGNGLFGLQSIIKQGNGRLAITSGGDVYVLDRGIVRTFENLPVITYEYPSTTIDFQFDYSTDVSLDRALVFRGIPYQLTNLWLEGLEDVEGKIVYRVKDYAEGTGTRISAQRVRNEIMNILQERPRKVVLDFNGVAVISSSFADELIAKLLLELGLYQFNRIIVLTGLDSTQQNVLHRSVIQRMVEEFSVEDPHGIVSSKDESK